MRPEDWNLLGIQWRNQFYIDTCLPFGLISAPFLFNQFLQHNHGVRHLLHYLDDFFTAGSPGSMECSDNLQAMLSLCDNINAPVKTSKIEGSSPRLTFLGIIIDTDNMTAGISPERKEDLLLSIQFLQKKNKCTKHQLLSLAGKLSFACKVVPAGRKFLRSLINLNCTVSRMHHHLRLCTDAYVPRPRLVVGLPPHLEWNIKHPGDKLVHIFIHVSIHRCIQHPRLGGHIGQETEFKPGGHLTKWTGTSFGKSCLP